MNSQILLKNSLWNSKKYYSYAHEASLDFNHHSMKILMHLAHRVKRVLDIGCGDGTRLNLLTRDKGVGIDISQRAIKLAKDRPSQNEFLLSDMEKLPFTENTFDLVYSAFVLEHLDHPEQCLVEAIRVITKKGHLVLIAPNFGAPNRASPPYKKSRIMKLLTGFIGDISRLFYQTKYLAWNRVDPMMDVKKYKVDYDTTIEPYLGSLINFLKSKNMDIVRMSSGWSEELSGAKIHQKLFKFFGEKNIYPFWMWGPHLIVVAKKL